MTDFIDHSIMFDPISPSQTERLWALLVRSESPRCTLLLSRKQYYHYNSEQRLNFVRFETREGCEWWIKQVREAERLSKLDGYTYRQKYDN